jgi:hypothetical protein
MINYSIPLNYNLNIYDLFNDINYIECTFNYKNKIFTFNNFSLYANKKFLIYKITSIIPLECLLDFFHNYQNIIIKKIYYFLISKYLLEKDSFIKKELDYLKCLCLNDFYDIILRTRDYHICHNNEIIITDYLNYNICLIITNNTLNKSFIAIIDRNCLIQNLEEIIIESKIYKYTKYEDIQIILIGGSIDEIDIIINIYKILKELQLSKFIYKTYLFKNKPLKRLKFNSYTMTITKIKNDSHIIIEPERDNSGHILNNNFYSNLHRV